MFFAVSASLSLIAPHALSQGLSPSTPAKEFIRLEGRVIAIENASPSAASGNLLISSNPFVVTDGTGQATGYVVSWANVSVDVYAASTLLCSLGTSGVCGTGKWITNGLVFTLKNHSTGTVLATATSVVQSYQLVASQNPIIVTDGSGLGVTTISFTSATTADLYAGSTLFCGDTTSGSCTTGKWVSNGMVFTLKDHTTQNVLGTLTAYIVTQ
jgi:hypothetical protein